MLILTPFSSLNTLRLRLEGGLKFLKYAITIEKVSMIYLSPVQKEYVKAKWLGLKAVLGG
jgi:hypothetical protein